jgi:hypothetical protein
MAELSDKPQLISDGRQLWLYRAGSAATRLLARRPMFCGLAKVMVKQHLVYVSITVSHGSDIAGV